MEYFNNILCVEAQELISYGVMTRNVYKNMLRRGQLQVVRRGCRNTPALVAVDSLPSRYYQLLVERIGDPKTVTPKQTFALSIQSPKAITAVSNGAMVKIDCLRLTWYVRFRLLCRR